MDVSAEQRKAFLASNTQADAARVLGVSGKGFRDITRNVFGVHVSRGGTWDDRLRKARLAYALASNATERKAIADAYKSGK